MQKNIPKALIYPNNKYSSIEDIKNYDIIYLGSEFCQNLMPTEYEIIKSLNCGFKKIVLFVPFLTQEHFKKYSKFIKLVLEKFNEKIEISTSDLGIIDYMNRKFPSAVKNISRPLSIEFVRMKDEILKKIMKELKINAVETDEKIFANKLISCGIKFHIHTSYGFVALQRHCLFIKKISDNCLNICLNQEIKLKVPYSKHFTYARNNVYLKKIKNENIKTPDRIIYWP